MVATVFAGLAFASQWVWGLLLEPTGPVAPVVTLMCQIAFGVAAAIHAVCGVVVVTHHAVRDTIEQVKGRGG